MCGRNIINMPGAGFNGVTREGAWAHISFRLGGVLALVGTAGHGPTTKNGS